jgi:HAD superfamily hydrolase (TIGR01509 family)
MHTVFDFDRHFEGVYASCRLGLRKPDPRFFTTILDDLGVAPDQCLFVDDREVNCEAAGALGLRVHTFTGAEDLRERLRYEGVTLA